MVLLAERFSCHANVSCARYLSVVWDSSVPNSELSVVATVFSNTPPPLLIKWLLPGKLNELLNVSPVIATVEF